MPQRPVTFYYISIQMLKWIGSICVLRMFQQNFNKNVFKNHFMFYLFKTGLLKGAKRFTIVGVCIGLGCVVVVSFMLVSGQGFQ